MTNIQITPKPRLPTYGPIQGIPSKTKRGKRLTEDLLQLLTFDFDSTAIVFCKSGELMCKTAKYGPKASLTRLKPGEVVNQKELAEKLEMLSLMAFRHQAYQN